MSPLMWQDDVQYASMSDSELIRVRQAFLADRMDHVQAVEFCDERLRIIERLLCEKGRRDGPSGKRHADRSG